LGGNPPSALEKDSGRRGSVAPEESEWRMTSPEQIARLKIVKKRKKMNMKYMYVDKAPVSNIECKI
jgi:hypothetical protein